jgi:hypothetical protein
MRGEGLRPEALEARRVFAEQSLKLLPEARRTAREFWGLVEVLEQRYVETIGKVWSLFQKALIVDVDCYLRALEVNNVEKRALAWAHPRLKLSDFYLSTGHRGFHL